MLFVWNAEASDNDALYDNELDRVRQKLQRAYMRRDHYAQLYYRAMAELDETKWELSVAKNKIQELKSLGQLSSHICGLLCTSSEVCVSTCKANGVNFFLLFLFSTLGLVIDTLPQHLLLWSFGYWATPLLGSSVLFHVA